MRVLLVSSAGSSGGGSLAQLLSRQGAGCDTAGTPDEALDLLRGTEYLAVLADCRGGLPGPAVIRRLRLAGQQLPVIAVQAGGSARERAELLDLGADDVVEPACAEEELAARIRAVLRRSRGFTSSALRQGDVVLDLDSRQMRVHGHPLPLTRKEFALLRLLFLRRGTILTRDALMEHLHADGEEPGPKAIEVLVCKLRRKLAAQGAEWLVGTVWGTGYRLGDVPANATAAMAEDRAA
jgi:two-component system, cell cycle response regulator CtrA